jgi:hypothetical protein
LDEKKSKHVSLAQQNGFGPGILQSVLRLVKSTANPNTCGKECNKYDLTVLHVCDWLIMVIGPGALPLAASHLFVVPILVLWVRLETSQ